MSEPTPPSEAELMYDLFRGSDQVHGRSELTHEVTSKGKHESKSWLEKTPVTVAHWQSHLDGRAGIGIPPLNSDNKVRWGAVDVDVYDGLDLVELNARIQATGLPLVTVRSKSGGPHLYLFVNDWVPAKLMIQKLDAIAAFLGFGTSEIFPKQAAIAGDGKDFGSWINMPYFGGTRFFRYGLDRTGGAIGSAREFVEFARGKSITPADLEAYQTPSTGEVFPDGPPCLNRIFESPPGDFRNIILSNVAVYCKKAFPETWKEKLDEYNQRFAEPLGSEEVNSIKKSYDKKDYRYQCSKNPLCNFCNSSKCKLVKHGIGGRDFLPSSRSLTMVNTTPPIWYLDITLPDGTDKRLSLSTEELQTPRLFQRRCMDVIQQMPPTLKAEEWQEIVGQLMAHCAIIEVPPEMSPKGQFNELLGDFLSNRASTESQEDMLRGLPYRDTGHSYFRQRDLFTYLSNQKFVALKPHEQIAALRELGAEKGFKKIAGKGINYWMLPNLPDQGTEIRPAQFHSVI